MPSNKIFLKLRKAELRNLPPLTFCTITERKEKSRSILITEERTPLAIGRVTSLSRDDPLLMLFFGQFSPIFSYFFYAFSNYYWLVYFYEEYSFIGIVHSGRHYQVIIYTHHIQFSPSFYISIATSSICGTSILEESSLTFRYWVQLFISKLIYLRFNNN